MGTKSKHTTTQLSDKAVVIRLPESELELLNEYCAQTNQSKTAVIRSRIRRLKL